ncbi:fumarylacetoacetate hydrolase family protein [Consotaella salsifontis]|uniref:2-keto-4-pentenoate hydratase/2-oxohepta-3-ene-1,7-dioic acid hydratase (Catechol pathway) n=1 Tax=Consotaella salsifontis TaxID=1365950 RepID=A0A1T4MZB7_9HYPH|nr:fumarylacetoacetate hydrolase family protein [Consotaella salsifontis]SJZ72196.1 2-keto-4-pentenoate hydratase/2-oxohepta-3-ene-1,7-dioic acid hydratase (catechol pathway) [Consotaella salsifontis]
MRFVRFGLRGSEKPGAIGADGVIRDLSEVMPALSGPNLDPDNLARLEKLTLADFPEVEPGVRLCAPISGIGKILGVGPNYPDAARLAGFKINPEPTLFAKASTAASGPTDNIEIPRMSARTDWGVELAVVIGRTAKYVSVETAMNYIAGFTIGNDITERNFQLQRSGQWMKGKSHDTFSPLGPWLVTRDEMAGYDDIILRLEVNGEEQQNGSTRDMVFKVPYLVSYISRFMRLEPGDVILTGTPGGVGLSYDPPRFLKAGDRMRLSATGLGEHNYVCVSA